MALMELWRGRETGLLRCKSALDNRVVYVAAGRPIFARSERNADRLDQMLVRAGTITPDQAAKSLETQARQPQKRVGQILIEMGAIHLEQLHASVKLQVQNHILSLFTWAEGSYVFEPGALPTQEAITLDWDTPAAVLQGLRGLPLNYIRPLAPPKDAVIERNQDEAILRELQLSSAEQKLLALLVGRHPMEQLLALDFISHEALVRGLVTFAALGLVVVERPRKIDSIHLEPEGEGKGVVIDPFAGEDEPPGTAPAAAPPVIVPPWQPAAAARSAKPFELLEELSPGLEPAPVRPPPPVAPPRRGPRFAGPALAAFESEQVAPPPEPTFPEAGGATAGGTIENQYVPAQAAQDATHFSNLLSSPSDQAPESADDGGRAPEPAVPAAEPLYSIPPSVSGRPSQYPSQSTLPPSQGDQVSRALYDQILQEKQALQQRLITLLDERSGGAMVPRELFDQVQEEKRLLQEKMMMMLDELLKLRSQPTAAERARVRPFPGRKGEGK